MKLNNYFKYQWKKQSRRFIRCLFQLVILFLLFFGLYGIAYLIGGEQ